MNIQIKTEILISNYLIKSPICREPPIGFHIKPLFLLSLIYRELETSPLKDLITIYKSNFVYLLIYEEEF